MIVNWFLSGDTHSQMAQRVRTLLEHNPGVKPEETALIILGDLGANYYMNKSDWKHKREVSKLGVTIYAVRGNHEEKPALVPFYHLVYDENVQGEVWMEDEFPLIRYFQDGGEYTINDHSVLTIGGAYSIDKWYRLTNGWKWFPNEQLTQEEMDMITEKVKGKHYDFVFTHTCPISYEPVDLFLRGIDQSTVDKTMENWLEQIKDTFDWGVFCWGHYHADRLEAPHCEIFYWEIENLESVWNRWQEYDETGELDWWLPKSPTFNKK